MINKQEIHNTARAIIIADNHILLNYNPHIENRYYFLPGGHVEHYEKIEDTLKREMLEEFNKKGRSFTFALSYFKKNSY